jgi:cation:H+ antiporter
VIGSNIFNTLLILGISSVITPLQLRARIVRIDVPIMIAISLLLFPFGIDYNISRFEGCIFVLLFCAYTFFLYRIMVKNSSSNRGGKSTTSVKSLQTPLNILFIFLGLILLVFGSRWLVSGAVSLSKLLGVSEWIISVTIVASGTSLPEAATSIWASIRKEKDIAVGNIIGSNIFNVLIVLGIPSIISPHGLTIKPSALRFDAVFMAGAAVACFPVFFSHFRISRLEGAFFLLAYLVYMTLLFTKS